MNNYPILIRGPSRTKMVRIKAFTYGEARERAIMRYRNHFVNYKFARNMDLIEARVSAAKLSREKKSVIYLVNTGDEVELSNQEPKDLETVYGKFVNGTEDKEYLKSLSAPTANPTAVSKVRKIKSKITMATKPAKKVSAKKGSGKKVASNGNGKLWHDGLLPKATTLRFSKSQWEKLEKHASDNGGIQKIAHDAIVKAIGL